MSNQENFRPCIAFKMNYCNGGKNPERIGFYGICSDAIIKYNIEKKQRAWCSNDDCACKRYYDKKISRTELEGIWEEKFDGNFPCMESAALRDWIFGAAQPIRGAKTGHLCLLTTVSPNMNECDRFIVAMFIIGKILEGDKEEYGFVESDENFYLEFTPSESSKIKFWKIYHNADESIKWGSGLFRYFSDDDAVKFLKMAVEVKRGTDDEDFVKDFLNYYCKLNHLSI